MRYHDDRMAVNQDSVITSGNREISIPVRYIYSAVGTVKLSDLEVCVEFTLKYLEDYISL